MTNQGELRGGSGGDLAEGSKVEIDGNFRAFGREDLNGDSVGSEESCGEFEVKRGTGQNASALGTKVGGFSRETLRNAILISFKYLYVKVFPEVRGTQPIALRRAGPRAGGYGEERAVRRGEKNLDGDLDDLLLSPMIQCSLLRAVASGVRL